MSSKRYPPARESELVVATGTFESRIRTGFARYGLSETEAENYKTTRDRFVALYDQCNDETTRTRVLVNRKAQAKRTLINATRMLVRVCEAWPQMTNDLRIELGIPLRNRRPGPVPAPTASPYVKIEKVDGRLVTVVLQASKTTRTRPAGVASANIFVAYGAQMPTEPSQFTLFTGTNRSRNTLELDAGDAATTAWLSACWLNGRKLAGPACQPVPVDLAAVRVAPVTMKMKKAA